MGLFLNPTWLSPQIIFLDLRRTHHPGSKARRSLRTPERNRVSCLRNHWSSPKTRNRVSLCLRDLVVKYLGRYVRPDSKVWSPSSAPAIPVSPVRTAPGAAQVQSEPPVGPRAEQMDSGSNYLQRKPAARLPHA